MALALPDVDRGCTNLSNAKHVLVSKNVKQSNKKMKCSDVRLFQVCQFRDVSGKFWCYCSYFGTGTVNY